MRWSDPGDPATDHEAVVVAQAGQCGGSWEIVAWRLNQETGNPKLVASVLASIFDEIGGQNASVPTRRNFFQGLWRRVRDAQIVALAGKHGPAQIGRLFDLSPNRVSAILRVHGCPARYRNRGDRARV